MPVDRNPAVAAMQELARKFDVVIPVSIYECDGDKSFNSLGIIDAGGESLGVYRKAIFLIFRPMKKLSILIPAILVSRSGTRNS